MTLKRFFLCAFALLTVCIPALAAVSVIQPTGDFYVNDAADVLSDATEGHIVLNNDVLYDACGAQIVFVTLDTVSSTTLENYAYTLYNDWKIGRDGRGILVLMTVEDDDYWVVQGTGLQDYVTAGDLDEMIMRDLEPYFAEGNYDAGARALFDSLFDAVSRALKVGLTTDDTLYEQYVAQFENDSAAGYSTGLEEEDSGFSLFWMIVFIVLIIFIFSNSGGSAGRRPVYRRRSIVGPVILSQMLRSSRPSRGGFGARPSSFGGSRSSFGGSRPSGFGGGRSGGGGYTRGGGVGRHR